MDQIIYLVGQGFYLPNLVDRNVCHTIRTAADPFLLHPRD
jgi:hypothetical protein